MLQYILLKKHNNMNFPKKSSFSRRQEYLLLDLRERMIQRGERGGDKKRGGRRSFLVSPFLSKIGGYLLSHFYAVPSAWSGLTSLFGMGRGGPLTL